MTLSPILAVQLTLREAENLHLSSRFEHDSAPPCVPCTYSGAEFPRTAPSVDVTVEMEQ